ncbi:MAG: SAM-dependent methyltransferase [Paracoccus sp. (in: a-proteobacteria)]|uniref:class I SAM-dependent methyltransferase n=1 Tax=Paracoccus sp. TaxID=267 RepID=UPI0026DFCDBB|nr:SAM-dependent methyltransferase [Paracoccus sp. (in: a-proteobacteria)]MDO5621784.1 SAM-dependent methyltransferase [Paracoccus sp. (in: a-proteobacteria)]
MTSDPKTLPLIDRPALSRNRARALRLGLADFLHRIAGDEIHFRLEEINRRFTDTAVISGFPEIWSEIFPQARQLHDDDVLDLAPASLDLVIHALALHQSNDPVGQMVQAARALRPDGLFIGVVLGGETLAGLRDALRRAEAEMTGGLSPRSLPMAEIRDWGGLLGRAGLALPVADQISQKVSYRDLPHLARDLRAMGETNALTARLRSLSRRAIFTRAGEIMAREQADVNDPARISVTYEMIFLTGWSPADNQQKPLRPGSATTSLAEALNSQSKP